MFYLPEPKIPLTGVSCKYIMMPLCWQIVPARHSLHRAVTSKTTALLWPWNSSRQSGHGLFHLCVLDVAQYPSIYLWFFPHLLDHPVMLPLLATSQDPLPLLPALSSPPSSSPSPSSPLTLSSGNKMSATYEPMPKPPSSSSSSSHSLSLSLFSPSSAV